MIRSSYKIVILVITLAALVLHFALVLVFANPYAKTKDKIDYYAEWYIYPYFVQNWNLFVPPPNTNYKLFVEYEDEGKQRLDIFEEIMTKHQTNRLRGQGPLLLTFSNSIHYFEKNTELQNALNGPIKNDLYFQILEKSAANYINSTRNTKVLHMKLRLVVQTLNSNEERVYFN